MEMLLMGLGGCSSFDVMSILRKSRQEVIACHAELEAERADAVPAVFTRIHLHFVVTGRNLKENQVRRAVSLVRGEVLLRLHHAGKGRRGDQPQL